MKAKFKDHVTYAVEMRLVTGWYFWLCADTLSEARRLSKETVAVTRIIKVTTKRSVVK